jgi:hypothetical protein
MSFRPDRPPKPPQEHDPHALVEHFIEHELQQQYQGAVVALNNAGLWEPLLSSPTELGITGMDDKEYPLPTTEGIAAEMRNHPEVYSKKLEAGFGRILPVPMAAPLDHLTRILSSRILAHHNAGKLLAQDGSKLELDTNQPLYTWDGWSNADRNGQAIYYPTQFDQTNHGGKTKAQLLEQLQQSPFPGYNLLLLPKASAIPQQWKPGQRVDLAPGKSGRDYLQTLNTTPDYAHEAGLTLEDWLTLALAHLETTNQVLDDYQGDGKSSWLTGSYHPSSGVVGYASWGRGGRRADLAGYVPGNRSAYDGLRPAVRMGRLAV